MIRPHTTSRRPHQFSLLLLGLLLGTVLLTGCANSMASTAKGDPGGIATGTKGDVVGQVDGAPQFVDSSGKATSDLTQVAKDADGNPISEIDANKDKEPLAYALSMVIGQNRIAINIVWTLVTGYLVMFMQAGFALVETGFTRAKSAAHTMMMNFMVYGLGMLGYFIVRLCLPVRRHRRTADARRRLGAGLSGEVTLTIGREALRPVRDERLLPDRRHLRRRPSRSCSCSRWSSWIPPRRSRRAPWPSAGSCRHSASSASSSRPSPTRSSATGRGAAAG